MILPRNRTYVDWAVPVDVNGNEIGVCAENQCYRCYLEWLAGYLYATEIPVPENQRALLEQYKDSGTDHAVLDLSDSLGYSIWETEAIQEESASGLP